jgi:hypothetical protein
MIITTVPPHSPPYHRSIDDPHSTSPRLHSEENPQRNSPTPANPAIALPPPFRRQLLDLGNPELQLGFRRRFAQHASGVCARCITKKHEIRLAPRRLPSPSPGCSFPNERYVCSRVLVVWRARVRCCVGGIGQSLGCAGSLDRVCCLGGLVAWVGCGGGLCLVWGVLLVGEVGSQRRKVQPFQIIFFSASSVCQLILSPQSLGQRLLTFPRCQRCQRPYPGFGAREPTRNMQSTRRWNEPQGLCRSRAPIFAIKTSVFDADHGRDLTLGAAKVAAPRDALSCS